jgi:hypothetical protein
MNAWPECLHCRAVAGVSFITPGVLHSLVGFPLLISGLGPKPASASSASRSALPEVAIRLGPGSLMVALEL